MTRITVCEVVVWATSQDKNIHYMLDTAIEKYCPFKMDFNMVAVLCELKDVKLFMGHSAPTVVVGHFTGPIEQMLWAELRVFSADEVRAFAKFQAEQAHE